MLKGTEMFAKSHWIESSQKQRPQLAASCQGLETLTDRLATIS